MESKRLNMHYWVVWKKEEWRIWKKAEEERSKELIEERESVGYRFNQYLMGGLVVQYMEWFSGSKKIKLNNGQKQHALMMGLGVWFIFFNSKLNIIWKIVGGKIGRD
jgi:hypothetical protein